MFFVKGMQTEVEEKNLIQKYILEKEFVRTPVAIGTAALGAYITWKIIKGLLYILTILLVVAVVARFFYSDKYALFKGKIDGFWNMIREFIGKFFVNNQNN